MNDRITELIAVADDTNKTKLKSERDSINEQWKQLIASFNTKKESLSEILHLWEVSWRLILLKRAGIFIN